MSGAPHPGGANGRDCSIDGVEHRRHSSCGQNVKWPSMRRPVGVKWIRLFFRWTCFSSAEWPLTPCFHPHSQGAIRFARCMLGVLVSAGAAICLAPCGSALFEWNPGQAIDAVTGTRRFWLLFFPFPRRFRFLCCHRHCFLLAIVQRFVRFSAHPQMMQQHRQLSRGQNHRAPNR
jgi:hypothetical protein